jgi:hypothetical protein
MAKKSNISACNSFMESQTYGKTAVGMLMLKQGSFIRVNIEKYKVLMVKPKQSPSFLLFFAKNGYRRINGVEAKLCR